MKSGDTGVRVFTGAPFMKNNKAFIISVESLVILRNQVVNLFQKIPTIDSDLPHFKNLSILN